MSSSFEIMLVEMYERDDGTVYMRFVSFRQRKVYNRWMYLAYINVREYRRGNQKRTIQRNWQHRIHKAKKNTEKLATQDTQGEEKHRETGNIGYTRRRKAKQTHNIICVVHRYAQTNTNNVNKSCVLLQTNGGKNEPNIVALVV